MRIVGHDTNKKASHQIRTGFGSSPRSESALGLSELTVESSSSGAHHALSLRPRPTFSRRRKHMALGGTGFETDLGIARDDELPMRRTVKIEPTSASYCMQRPGSGMRQSSFLRGENSLEGLDGTANVRGMLGNNQSEILAGLTHLLGGSMQAHGETLWAMSSVCALRALPFFLLMHQRWNECLSICFGISSLYAVLARLGMNALLDSIDIALANIVEKQHGAQPLRQRLEALKRFIQKCGAERVLLASKRMSGLLELALSRSEHFEEEVSELAGMHVQAVQRMITNVETFLAQALKSKHYSVSAGEASLCANEGVACILGELQSYVRHGGAEALSRPWRARLLIALEAGQHIISPCAHCGLIHAPQAACCVEDSERLYTHDHERTFQEQCLQTATCRASVCACTSQSAIVQRILDLIEIGKTFAISVAGATGSGKTAVLGLLTRRLRDSGVSRVVYMQKVAWHTEAAVVRFLHRELSHDGADTSLVDALLLCGAEGRRLVLVVDGVVVEEAEMLASAVNCARRRGCTGVCMVVSKDARSEWEGWQECAVSELGETERKGIIAAEAEARNVPLTQSEVTHLAAMQGSASPAFLITCVKYLALCRRPEGEESWMQVFTLPDNTEDLYTNPKFGIIRALEVRHSVQIVSTVLRWLFWVRRGLAISDLISLAVWEGNSREEAIEALSSLLLFVETDLEDPSSPVQGRDEADACVHSTADDRSYSADRGAVARLDCVTWCGGALLKACREYYSFSEPPNLAGVGVGLVARRQIQWETDAHVLRKLLQRCDGLPPTSAVHRVRGWLSAERLLRGEGDADALRRLVSACGMLSNSESLTAARRMIECEDESSACMNLDELRALTDSGAQNKRARTLLECEGKLANTTDFREMCALVSSLEGCVGSATLDRARSAIGCVGKLAGENDVESLRRALDVCGFLTGCVEVDDALRVVSAEVRLGEEADMEHLCEGLGICEGMNETKNIRQAKSMLDAVEALEGEVNVERVKELAVLCGSLCGDGCESIRRAREALDAVHALEGEKDISRIRECVLRCEWLRGSSVLEEKKALLDAEDALLVWMPFAVTNSVAKKLQKTLQGKGLGSAELRSKIHELFGELDDDASGSINKGEFDSAFRKMGINLSAAELDCVMRATDRDGEGSVDAFEFVSAIENILEKAASVVSYEDEARQIRSLAEKLNQAQIIGSKALEGARFKADLASLQELNDRTWLDWFYREYADMVEDGGYVTGATAEKRGWVDAAKKLDVLLARGGSLAKKDVWLLVQSCGSLSGCVSLAHARMILGVEQALSSEADVVKMREKLSVCGMLQGSPAVQRASILLECEDAVRALIRTGCTTHQLVAALRRCRPLRGSQSLDQANRALAAEVALQTGEKRSHTVRRLLALCDFLQNSFSRHSCLVMIDGEDALSQLAMDLSDIHFAGLSREGMPSEDGVYEGLCKYSSEVRVPARRLSRAVTSADELRARLAQCGNLCESFVMEEAWCVLQALAALPRTDEHHRTRDIGSALVCRLGSKHLKEDRVREMLRVVYDGIDQDRSGSVDLLEIDVAFFELGVNLLPDDRSMLLERFDNDQSGEFDFDEFVELITSLVRGMPWYSSPDGGCDRIEIRRLLEVCGHLHTGKDSQWVSNAWSWVRAEDRIIGGLHDLMELNSAEDECGGLENSEALEKARNILRAAAEIAFATDAGMIRDHISVCGHLTNAPDVTQKQIWLDGEDELKCLGYGQGWAAWVSCDVEELKMCVKSCGQLSGSTALEQAKSVLRAEEELASAVEEDHIRRLLEGCGHLHGSQSIEVRRLWLRTAAELSRVSDVCEVQKLCEKAGDLVLCSSVDSAKSLLLVEESIVDLYTETDLRNALVLVGGRLTGSENLRIAMRRFSVDASKRRRFSS